MRRLKRRKPGLLADITVRCNRAELRLRPDDERTNVLGFWLAKARAKCPGIQIFAVTQMSNHAHLVVRDTTGQLSEFMQYFLGHAAKRINKLDHVRGHVFERRFAEIEILDDPSFIRRIAYAICNPVEANLVRSHRDWTGLCAHSGARPVTQSFTVFHEHRYNTAVHDANRVKRDGGASVDKSAFYESAQLELAVLEVALAEQVVDAIHAREAELQADQKGVLGMKRVLAASAFDRPKWSKRSAMPLCFAATIEARVGFALGWRAFVKAFRQASDAFRRGTLGVIFPAGSFRPSTSTATTVFT